MKKIITSYSIIKSILKDTRCLCFTFIIECAEIAIQYGISTFLLFYDFLKFISFGYHL